MYLFGEVFASWISFTFLKKRQILRKYLNVSENVFFLISSDVFPLIYFREANFSYNFSEKSWFRTEMIIIEYSLPKT